MIDDTHNEHVVPEANSLIAESQWQVGAETAVSTLSKGYVGPCRIITVNDELVAVMPNKKEAFKVAQYAMSPGGGFGSVIVEEGSEQEITHLSIEGWL